MARSASKPDNSGAAQRTQTVSALPPRAEQGQNAAVSLLQRLAELRGLATSAEISFFVANGCLDVLRAQQVVVFERGSGRRLRVRSVTSLTSIDRTAPLISMFEEIAQSIERQGSISRACDFDAAALVQERCFHHLEAPVERVTGFDTPYPHSLEWAYFPGPVRIGMAIERVMKD